MPDSNQQNPSEIPTLYVNSVRVGLAFTDVKLYLGETIPESLPSPTLQNVPQQSAQKIVDRVCVVFSPDILPALIKGLTDAVSAYQANFGPLRIHPASVPTLPKQSEG